MGKISVIYLLERFGNKRYATHFETTIYILNHFNRIWNMFQNLYAYYTIKDIRWEFFYIHM